MIVYILFYFFKARTKAEKADSLNAKMMDELLKLKDKYNMLKSMTRAQSTESRLDIDKEASIHLTPGDPSHDMAFIKKSILAMYREDVGFLHALYLTNNILFDTNDRVIQKNVMSEAKQLELKNIFARRLRRLGLSMVQYNVRIDKFNTLLSKALNQIRKKFK